MQADLTVERPQWPLSAYGPGLKAPIQLFGGSVREISYEEVRLRHYLLGAQGQEAQGAQEFEALVREAETQNQTALNDIDKALQYVLDAEKEHPNRIDICNNEVVNPTAAPLTFQRNPPSTFGAAQNTTTSAFGSSTTTFGKPSVPVTTSQQIVSSPFGQAAVAQPTATSAPSTTFGQPSTMGNPFAAAAAAAVIPKTSTANPFSNATNTAPSPFGSSSTQTNGIFGQTHTQGGFGQTSNIVAPNPFAAASVANTDAFGSHSETKLGAGLPTASGPSVNPFAQASDRSSIQTQAQSSSAFGTPQSQPQVRRNQAGKLESWNGKPVMYINDEPCYRGDDRSWQRVWFADGPPAFQNSGSLPDSAYDDTTKESYIYLKEQKQFKDGVMPILPPRREWCNWNI